MNHPQGESIWGNINMCVEIALNVYHIYAEYGDGIMIPKSKVNDTLSPAAIKMGQEEDDWICFGEDTKDIPMFEMLQKRMALCKRIEKSTMEQIKEIQTDGKLRLTDYFGECSPPANDHENEKVRNGIYFTKDSKGQNLAVHEAVADNFMTPYASAFGKKEGEYLYYDLVTSVIPLHELKSVFTEAEALIISEDSLNATLTQNFPLYVKQYNSIVPEELHIQKKDAPKNLFLNAQLMQEGIEMQEETEENVPEIKYGEQVEDYGFEQ